MKLGSIGRPKPRHPDDDNAARLREARIGVARSCPRWTEVEEPDLVRRGPRNQWFVSASTDEVLAVHRGVVFQTGTTNVIADQARLFYFLDREGELVFLEKLPGTWSEYVARQERRRVERARA